MFQSSGYFKSVKCPFYKHDLCHRPYCHFKHVKPRKEKEKDTEEVAQNKTDTSKSDVEKKEPSRSDVASRLRSPSPVDDVNDDVLKIVKNISPTKLIEYAKRKLENKELQQTLEQVDKEASAATTTSLPGVSSAVVPPAPAVRTEDETRGGLIDSFYSKEKVPVNITSGDIVDKPKAVKKAVSFEKVNKGKEKIICNCDDPDCSGFQEETADNVFTHISIAQIEDEYMRRKIQRRLDRRKRGLTQPPLNEQTDIVIREADFFIPPAREREPDTLNGVDEDLSDYIDRCKEEYTKKLKEKKKAAGINNDQNNKDVDKEKKKSAGINNDQNNKDVDKEKKKSAGINNDQNNKDVDKEKKKSAGINDDQNNITIKDAKDNVSKKKPVKKVLSDIDFFSAKAPEDNDNVPDVDNNKEPEADRRQESASLNKDADLDNNVIKKKKRIFIPNELSEKPKTGKPLEKRDKVDEGSNEKSTTNSSKQNSSSKSTKPDDDKFVEIKSDKKSNKLNNIVNKSEQKVSKDISSKKNNEATLSKPDKNKNDQLHTKSASKNDNCSKLQTKSAQKAKNDDPSSRDGDQVVTKKTKTDNDKTQTKLKSDKPPKLVSEKLAGKHDGIKKKNSSSKDEKGSYEKSTSEKKTKANLSAKETSDKDKNNLKKADRNVAEGSKGTKGTKRTRTDSESSNTSRNAFDVIILLSSSDNESNSGKDATSGEEDYEPRDVPVDTYKSRQRTSSSCSDKDDGDFAEYSAAKKRVALTKEQIPRKPVQPHKTKSLKMSYVSPNLKASGNTDTVKTPVAKTTVQPHDEYVSSTVKKRISHVKPTPMSAKKDDDRPKLEVDIGGKVPHSMRQKYFDKIIDEFIPKMATKKEAYDKGIADEGDAYKRSNRKQIYINLCANIVKRIRSMPDYVPPPVQPTHKADPMRTAQPTTEAGTSKKPKSDLTNVSLSRIQGVTTAGYKKIDTKTLIPKNSIKPASSPLVNAAIEQRPHKKRERSDSLALEPMELTEDNFYEQMQQYLLTKEQLWDNKYPRRDPDNPELTQIKDYVPSTNTLKRQCCRCGKEYFMNKKGKYVTRNECNYHWGKLWRQRGRNSNSMIYTCCGVDAGGLTCAMCRLHVSHKVGPLENYASTESCDNKDSKRKVFALDCEMCYTTQGLELTRLTVIDFDLEQIIDLFVKPTNPIVDYNTRFSGVTREDLADVTTTITDIHDILLNMIDKETILLGHSLESDLNALNLIHERVVDTAIVFPHRMGLPMKRALRNLMVEYLQKVIQSGEGGHDSCEDARSCMELMKYKFKEDQKARKRLKSN